LASSVNGREAKFLVSCNLIGENQRPLHLWPSCEVALSSLLAPYFRNVYLIQCSVIMKHIVNTNVGMPIVVASFNQTPMFEWYVIRCGSLEHAWITHVFRRDWTT
jgi:hypothetical protein